ncbi:radical SAM protein [bacterium]|jgi:MoaA/NifB/PqqE/SkfB family radical SAM enzyme|nr:radical SAM protein [bacterium]
MFYQGDIIGIHLEPTSKCNAKCPQCPRNVFGSSHLLDNLQEEDFPIELLDQIDIPVLNDVLINGNYGDIVMHSKPKEFIEALVNKWGARREQPTLRIHTNGSALKKDFWEYLGSLKIHVEFGIDGVTNEQHILYRQNTRLDKVLENAKSFINAGGEASWAMTLFKHNQSSVEIAKQMAKDLGFMTFKSRPSTRFSHFTVSKQRVGAVLNDDFSVKHWLQPINDGELQDDLTLTSKNIQRQYQKQHALGSIVSRNEQSRYVQDEVNCEVKESSRVYVSARGKVTPCCYLERIQKWDKDCATLGIDPNFNSLHNNKISDILKHNFWNILDNSIKSKKVLGTCSFNCGTSNKAKLNILGKNPVKYNAIS